jgi:hypothetical protein
MAVNYRPLVKAKLAPSVRAADAAMSVTFCPGIPADPATNLWRRHMLILSISWRDGQ